MIGHRDAIAAAVGPRSETTTSGSWTEGSSCGVAHDNISDMLFVSLLLLVSRRHVDYGRMDSMLCRAH